jgi:hypothetical protein
VKKRNWIECFTKAEALQTPTSKGIHSQRRYVYFKDGVSTYDTRPSPFCCRKLINFFLNSVILTNANRCARFQNLCEILPVKYASSERKTMRDSREKSLVFNFPPCSIVSNSPKRKFFSVKRWWKARRKATENKKWSENFPWEILIKSVWCGWKTFLWVHHSRVCVGSVKSS